MSYLTPPAPLIPTTSALYLRRLVKELNALPDGFYLVGAGEHGGNLRCICARFTLYGLHVIPCGNRGFRAIPADSTFIDAYGQSVVASRRAAK